MADVDQQKSKMQAALDTQFVNGHVLYRGYVDDPRNTDNAWMETVAVNFHDATGTGIGAFHLHAGDDAGAVGQCFSNFSVLTCCV